MTIPERSMVAGVIVRVADEDDGHQAAEQFMQGRARVLEAQPDNLGEVLVRGMSRHLPCRLRDLFRTFAAIAALS